MTELSFVFLKLYLFYICCSNTLRGHRVSVHTNIGEIIGFTDTAVFNGTFKDVTKFLGIPFAKPPTGPLRFRKPVPEEKFTSPFNASMEGPACPQDPKYKDENLQTSEDCLSLNIYTPGFAGNGNGVSHGLLPVMAWIYGGGFVISTTTYYDGSILSSFHDVIVVIFNYRVSVFGFLATGDSSARGNYGLWDQHVALKWVHNNIPSFGGDPSNVTIFGESAGSASVMYQALYPGNKGFFQRVIGQSGAALSPWALQPNMGEIIQNLNLLASHVNCSSFHLSSVVDCLRRKPVAEIMDLRNFHRSYLSIRDNFIPVVDGEFLQISPETIFMGKDPKAKLPLKFFTSLDVMLGLNGMDGAAIVLTWQNICRSAANETREDECLKIMGENEIIPAVTKAMFFVTNTVLNKAVNFEYTDWSKPNDKNRSRDQLIDFATDYKFLVPAIRMLDLHFQSNAPATYFYQFAHRPSYDGSPDWVSGANHAVDLAFTFGFPDSLAYPLGFNGSIITDEEIQLSSRMMLLFTNFAKCGGQFKDRHSSELTYLCTGDAQSLKFSYNSSTWTFYTPKGNTIISMKVILHESQLLLYDSAQPHFLRIYIK